MGWLLTEKKRIALQRGGSLLAFIAAVGWLASLPFSMAQQVRFTSIFLFAILGAFLIQVLAGKQGFFRVGFRQFLRLLPMALLALLPLLHFIPSGENQRELVLTAPLFLLPWILLWHNQEDWFRFSRVSVLVLAASFFVLLGFLVGEGPLRVWHSVRSETELPDVFLLARPQMGFLAGVVFFLLAGIFALQKNTALFLFAALTVLLLQFWILSKIALGALLMALCYFLLRQLKRKPMLLLVIVTFLLTAVILLGSRIWQSGLVQDALSREGLSFQKYPKAYVNSINSRVVLWKAGFDVLRQGDHFVIGMPSGELQEKLDAAVAVYNAYLTGQHLNPHNQFLYFFLHYGMAGVLVFLIFWLCVFRCSWHSPLLSAMWVFAFICCQTEIFLDREFGSQLYLFMLVYTLMSQDSAMNLKKPGHA